MSSTSGAYPAQFNLYECSSLAFLVARPWLYLVRSRSATRSSFCIFWPCAARSRTALERSLFADIFLH